MIYGIYSIKDRKANFGIPFPEINDALAMRKFHNALLQENTEMFNFGSDFELYKIGEFDDITGLVKSIDKVFLYGGKDHVEDAV